MPPRIVAASIVSISREIIVAAVATVCHGVVVVVVVVLGSCCLSVPDLRISMRWLLASWISMRWL